MNRSTSRGRRVRCPQCHNETIINADHWPGDLTNQRVIESLYSRAVGFYYDTEKVFCTRGRIIRAKTKEYVPPDPGSAMKWLANRMPAEWRERQDVFVKSDVSDADKSPEQLMYELMRDMLAAGAIELKEGVKLIPPPGAQGVANREEE
jgi:hypothetical protein